jgi:hypothetical protein
MPAQLPVPARDAPPFRPGWKHELESRAGSAAEYVSRQRRNAVPWRRVLVDGGLLLAMLLTSSWLVRG